MMETGVTGKIVYLAGNTANTGLIIPSLRTIGNFVTGNDDQTEMVIQCGFLEIAILLLTHEE